MALPSAAIDAIFNRPRDAAAILFLIEDSRYMSPLWQHVREAYLPSLLNAIQVANPTAAVSQSAPALSHQLIVTLQTEALWMTTSQHVPPNPSFDPSTRRAPRWNDIPFVSFTPHGETTISPINVTSAIEVRQASSRRLCSDTTRV